MTQSFLTLCDPMDCSTPGFPVLHHLLEFAQTHVHWISDAIQPPHPPSPSLSLYQHQGQMFALGGQSIGASTSESVLPMNIQGWFPLGLTGLISLQSKVLSRVFFSTKIQKHQFFSAQLSLWFNSHIRLWLLDGQLWAGLQLTTNHLSESQFPIRIVMKDKWNNTKSGSK